MTIAVFRLGIAAALGLACACGDDERAAGGAGGAGAAATGGATNTGASGGGTTTGGQGVGGAGGTAPEPPPGNAVVLDDGRVVPLYPVSSPGLGTRAIGFAQGGGLVQAVDEHGAPLWSKDLGAGSLFGGFDFDADGIPDLGLARSEDQGQPCGGLPSLRTWLDVARGRDGELFTLTDKQDALCWTFGGTTYPTTQWTSLGVLFGPGPILATAPYYAQVGRFLSFAGALFDEVGAFTYPSTAAFDADYTADQPNAYGQAQSFVANAHVANGLGFELDGQPVTAFFTSSRVVVYRDAPLASDQLLLDLPFLTGQRTDLAGRNYGLVAPDPLSDHTIVLVAGTGADTVRDDMMSGTMSSDPYGQIERHVTMVDLVGQSLEDRFFSYAHDGGDAFLYEGRVVYPNNPFVPAYAGGFSPIAFNVYEGGRWRLHITGAGITADSLVIPDRFLWDIADLDGDGAAEWVLSPTRDPAEPDVAGYYFPKWRTVLGHWDLDALTLSEGATFEGIPYLLPTFRTPTRSTSRGSLYPVLTERRSDGTLGVLLQGPDGAPVSVDL